MYINDKIREELRQNECRITRINNMLVTPLQNNMTYEKEAMLKAELEFLYKSQERIYKNLTKQLDKRGE